MQQIENGRLNKNSKSSRTRYFFFGLLIILAIGNSVIFAQSAQHTENNADQSLRSSGRVNPSSLGMEMSIPIGAYPGRGISIPVSISYSSKVWRMEYNGMEMIGGTANNQGCFSKNIPTYSENSASGWTSSMGIAYVEYTGEDNSFTGEGKARDSDFCADTQNPNYGYIKRIQIHLPSGASHELRASDIPITYPRTTQPEPINMSGTYYSVDGSNLKYVEGSRRLYLPDGSYYDFSTSKSSLGQKTIRRATKYRDVNGNQVTYYEPNSTYPNGYWIDTLGKTIPVPLPLSSPTAPDVVDYDMPGIGGTTRTYKLHWKLLKDTTAAESGLTDFTQVLRHVGDHSGLPEGENSPTGPVLFGSGFKDYAIAHQNDPLFNPVVLTAVEFPNGQMYKFTYNIYGEIEHIDYPTGSEEDFIYAAVPTISSSLATGPSKDANRGITERKLYESNGATPYIWTYTGGTPGTAGTIARVITAPDGTRTETDYHKGNPPPCLSCTSNKGSWGFTNVLTGKALETRSFASNNQIMSKTKTTWEKTEFPILLGEVDAQWHPRVTKVESIVYDLSGNYLSSTSTMAYAGNLNDIDNHLDVNLTKHYGYTTTIGGLGTLERQTEITVMEYDSGITWSNYENKHIIGLPTLTVLKDGNNNIVAQSEIVYDESGYSGGTYRGHLTRTRSWLDTDNSWIEIRAKYDTHGNMIEATDAKGNISKIDYTDNFSDTTKNGTNKVFPTKTTSAIPGGNGSTTAFETTTEYDFQTGLPISTTNINGQTSEMKYDDPLLRSTKTIAPNGHQTITEYGVPDSSGQLLESERFIKVKSQIDDTNWSEDYKWFDGLSRTIRTQEVNEKGDIFTKTKYDSLGRIEKASNPYRGENTPDNQLEWTKNFYDVAGRVNKVQTPDLAEVTTSYSIATTGSNIGTVVTVTDQAGKERRSITNGLGQLKRVDEPTTAGLGTIASPNQATSYNYDTLNNLTTVNQGQQMRTFQYDSLSRLKQATNPESGTISYIYDGNGNLTSKTDARSITTTYDYDNINRVTQRSYSDSITPTVDYFYDNLTNAKGQLIKISSSVSTTEYTQFDTIGRLKSHKQTTDGESYTTGYEYNLSGAIIEQTYPSGRKVKNLLNNDGKTSIVQSNKSANAGYFDYAKSFTYNATGAMSSMQLGNGKWESTTFNSRRQPTQIALGTVQNGTDKLKLNFDYNTVGQNDNNGNVLKQTITVPDTVNATGFTAIQTYAYDELNRLESAEEKIANVTSWKQAFTFDRYGNKRFDEANTDTIQSGCATAVCNPTIDPETNKLVGYTFDNAGNTEIDANGRTFTYDAENKQILVVDSSNNTVGEYFYDGDGKRIKKVVPNTGETTVFVYDASGKTVAEYSTIVETTNAKVSYLTSDHLGSPRITTDKDGDVYTRRDFMPFGEEIDINHTSQRTATLNYASDGIRQKFTSYERDDETDLDFAQARMHNYNFGRFTSTDPSPESTDLTMPQSINRYIYVMNNPYLYIDPTGMIWVKKAGCSGSSCQPEWIDDEEWNKYSDEQKKALSNCR